MDKLKLNIKCEYCEEDIITYVTGLLKDGYNIPCPLCNETFVYKPLRKNMQCHQCSNIHEYVIDERAEYLCVECGAPFTGYVTRNKDSILKAIRANFAAFPPEYNHIKEQGVTFIASFLEASHDLSDTELKSSLAEFQKGVYWMIQHLIKGLDDGDRNEDTSTDQERVLPTGE